MKPTTLHEETITREYMLTIPAQEISDPAVLGSLPLVSVVMITYNHEAYIAEAIQGVISQACSFPFELLIGEDCSTDATRAICLDFQRRYPHLIRIITADRNEGMIRNYLRLRARMRGKYMAFCEGDDFWTDPGKLERQVQYMEANPECPACFTRFRIVRQTSTGTYEPAGLGGPTGPARDFDIEGIFKSGVYIHICTMLERASAIQLPIWFLDTLSADWVCILLNAEQGPLHFMPEITAVYRRHATGIWNGSSEEHRVRRSIATNRLLARHFAGRYSQWFDRAHTDLQLTLARILIRLGLREDGWAVFRGAWRGASRKRWLLRRETFKFVLAFTSNRAYSTAESCIRRIRGQKQAESAQLPAPNRIPDHDDVLD